jgi:hypothetical protein
MGIYLLQNSAARSVKSTRQLIVQAESAADAKVMAASHFNGDGSWADATATALTASTLDANASMLGWVFKIVVTGAAGQTVDPITATTTGAGTDDLDAIAADLVTALNANTDIANAAYSAPNLTVATGSGGDDLGDATVVLEVYPPSGNTKVNLASLFIGAGGITHEGVATDALAIALVADTEATPSVLAEA